MCMKGTVVQTLKEGRIMISKKDFLIFLPSPVSEEPSRKVILVKANLDRKVRAAQSNLFDINKIKSDSSVTPYSGPRLGCKGHMQSALK